MEISSILMASVVLVLLLIYWRGIINYFKFWRKVKRLPQIKSHFLFGVIWELMVPRNKLVERATALFSRSPALFATWVGPLAAFGVTRAKHLEVILGSAKHIDKAKIYEFLEPWLNTGILTSSGSKWHSRRKMITPAFHFSILENFIGVFAEKSQILIEKLKKEVESKKFDVTPYITLCTLDVICETSMGVKINAQGVGEESEYVKAVCSITEEGMTRFLSPWLYPDFLFYLSPPGRRFKTYLKTLHNFSNKVIRQRREEYSRTAKNYNFSEDYYAGKKNKLTFLDLLLEYSENEYGLTDEDIREEVDTIMFEGHDTITSAICWSLQMLASHKDVQSKVQQEIENIFQGSDRPANSKDLNEMKYLERVIKETLRLYPSVPLIGRTLNVDLQLDGNIVPAGMMLGFPIFYIHRDPEQFPDPDKFDPDHFLPERVVARHPYAYVPFSAGPRNCIGQKFAMLEMKVVLSSILRHYDLHATGPVPTSLIRVLLKPENGVQLRITPRSSLT